MYEKLKSPSTNEGLIKLNKVFAKHKSTVIQYQHWCYNQTFFKQIRKIIIRKPCF